MFWDLRGRFFTCDFGVQVSWLGPQYSRVCHVGTFRFVSNLQRLSSTTAAVVHGTSDRSYPLSLPRSYAPHASEAWWCYRQGLTYEQRLPDEAGSLLVEQFNCRPGGWGLVGFGRIAGHSVASREGNSHVIVMVVNGRSASMNFGRGPYPAFSLFTFHFSR